MAWRPPVRGLRQLGASADGAEAAKTPTQRPEFKYRVAACPVCCHSMSRLLPMTISFLAWIVAKGENEGGHFDWGRMTWSGTEMMTLNEFAAQLEQSSPRSGHASRSGSTDPAGSPPRWPRHTRATINQAGRR